MNFIILLYFLTIAFSNASLPHIRETIANPRTSSEDYLLPKDYLPVLYEVELEPDFEKDTFNGSIRITLSILRTTNSIILHKNEIEVEDASIRLLDQNENVVNSVLETKYSEDDTHFYHIIFEDELLEGATYILVIGSFTGILNRDDEGFYLAKYTDENGNERKLGTTQFEATAARRAFPCFDEPALKAKFEITLIRPANYNSISNTPLVSTTLLSEGRYQDRFARTVQMSTYLVAFVVSDFEFVARESHRVFGRSEIVREGRGNYALEISEEMLNGIGEMVDVPYSLSKMDQVGIPDGYFWAGAMENWGLVTYREFLIMYADRITDTNTKELIATIMGHEYGHQWFGNLVSPLLWKYLWLNEGFATYFQYFGGDIPEKDMELIDQYNIKIIQSALRLDSSESTRPMTQDAGSPSEILSLFDIIAYDKSGSVIKMVEEVLSKTVFLRGLNIYLNNLEYNAAQPSDLYNGWQQALDESGLNILPENENVSSVLTTWETNSGYPLITVSRNYQSGLVEFRQRRFIDTKPNNDDESLWYVPINYATETNFDFSTTSVDLWLTTRSLEVNLNNLQAGDWLIINKRQSGYFRVNYDDENWNRIGRYLLDGENYLSIDRLTKAQLIDDSFTLARYGVIDYQIPLDLSQYLVRETDYIPLYPFFSALTFLDTHLANSDSYQYFQDYILNLLQAAYNSVGLEEFETDHHLEKLNRENILTWVCQYGDLRCREFALQKVHNWQIDSNDLILPNLQTVLSCAALRIGNQNDWNFLYGKSITEETVVKQRILAALGCSENIEILDNFVNNIIFNNQSALDDSHRLSAFAFIYNSGNFGLNYAYNYIKLNYEAVAESLTRAEIQSLINGIAARFSTNQQLNDLEEFGNSINDMDLVSSAILVVENNVNWSNQYLPSILSALRDNNIFVVENVN